MKKHHFLHIELNSTVSLTPADKRQMDRYLVLASKALEKVFSSKALIKNGHLLQVSLLFCGDYRIRKLNKEFRNKDYVTDVLSFPSHQDLRKQANLPMSEGQLFLGDLAICHPQVKRQARKFDVSYWDEFIHLFIHGVLHLLGYDHEVSLMEAKNQQDWEDQLIEKISQLKKKA